MRTRTASQKPGRMAPRRLPYFAQILLPGTIRRAIGLRRSLKLGMAKRGVLLINLGSPDSPSVPDVRTYLREFLGDKRVLDLPSPLRWLLLEGVILRSRPKKSASAYASIWTPEGSPLIRTSERVRRRLQEAVGPDVSVYVAMRYGKPPIAEVVAQLAAEGVTDLLVIPQYAHYAMSSWETVVVRVYEELGRQAPKIQVRTVQPFYADPDYIDALTAVSEPYLRQPHDHVLFSYHGLPVRHLRKADSSGAHCTRLRECCTRSSPAHATCYRAQVFATTRALARRLGLTEGRYSIAFQSRLAGEPWLEPYTDHELQRLARDGVRRLLVVCPAFVADCLETLEEISVEGRDQFLAAGGESFTQIPCLNDQAPYIDFLAGRVGLNGQILEERTPALPSESGEISASFRGRI
jgi:protoporphyrin/coproporphyrin ferrochelatase